jgi:transforming growth factor-beta-induced protein
MTKLQSIFGFLLIGLLGMGVVACNDDDEMVDPDPDPVSITATAAADDQFSTLVAALQRVDLDVVLDDASQTFTVFAPTNTAFANSGINLDDLSDEELTEVLLYHVLGGARIAAGDLAEGNTYASTAAATGPGETQLSMLVQKDADGNVKVNNVADVEAADVEASNGIIHVIDAVLLPLDVVGHAAANSDFSSLVGALGAANGDLVNVLSGDGPFTVFAPVNSAFADIQSTVDGLDADQLASVLTYHVVGGANVRSTDLTDGQVVTTVQTEDFTVNIDADGNVTITDANGGVANVIFTDVQGTNGVVHVLDAVIIPSEL